MNYEQEPDLKEKKEAASQAGLVETDEQDPSYTSEEQELIWERLSPEVRREAEVEAGYDPVTEHDFYDKEELSELLGLVSPESVRYAEESLLAEELAVEGARIAAERQRDWVTQHNQEVESRQSAEKAGE